MVRSGCVQYLVECGGHNHTPISATFIAVCSNHLVFKFVSSHLNPRQVNLFVFPLRYLAVQVLLVRQKKETEDGA